MPGRVADPLIESIAASAAPKEAQAIEAIKCKRLYLLLVLLICAFPALAERPKIGLALSGGGAKGSAHLAVIELLEANNIPVDYIAGTSIGAYVGGMYALGYSAEEIRQIMFNADFDSGFSDAIDRDKLPYRLKRQHDKFNVGLELGYRDGEIRFPWGVFYGQSMNEVYRRSVGNIPSFHSFDDLAIPFHAIATDLTTSQPVILDRGNLIRAMKASATVPGALVPTKIDGKLLVDGGMSQNLPVRQVKKMGADIVIAIDISAPLQSLDDINNAIKVLDQISSFLTVNNVNDDIAMLGDDDFYIRPEVDHLGTSDFSKLGQAYEAGMAAATLQVLELRRLSIDSADFLAYKQRKSAKLEEILAEAKRPVAKIILSNKSSYNTEFLLHTLGLEPDKPITTEEMLAAVDRLYSLDLFERVDAYFEEQDVGRVLLVEVVDKSWGPNFIEVGLGWEDDFTVDSVIDIDFAFTLGNITDNNGEWRNEIGFGTDKIFRSELHLPIDRIQQYYQSTVYEFRRENLESFVDNNLDATFESNSHRLDLAIGSKLGNQAIVEVGLSFERGYLKNELVLASDLKYESPGVYLRLGYDSLDRLSFPTRGNRLQFSLIRRDEELSGEDVEILNPDLEEDYLTTQYLLEWKGATSLGNHGFIARATAALLDSETDSSVHFVQLGGFLNLSGYHRDALVGDQSAFTSLQYQYNLGRSLFNLQNFPIYAGVSAEAGNVWSGSESIAFSELITAGSIYLSTDSKLGPIALAYGFSEDDNNSIYFYLGKNI